MKRNPSTSIAKKRVTGSNRLRDITLFSAFMFVVFEAAALGLPERLSCNASDSPPAVWEKGMLHIDFVTPIMALSTPSKKTLYTIERSWKEGQDRVLSILGKTDAVTGVATPGRDRLKFHQVGNQAGNVFRVVLSSINNPSNPPMNLTCLGQS